MSGVRGMQQLQALERWRRMQLDTAQSQLAAALAHAEQQRTRVAQCMQQLLEVQELVRSELRSAQPLSAVALLQLTQFVSLQVEVLRAAEALLGKAQAEADAAHQVVKTCFQELSVVQKLSARRGAQLKEALARQQQRALDEQAAGRRAPAGSALRQ